MLILTAEQLKAHDQIIDWVKSRGMLLTLGGYAGVGKTSLLGVVAGTLKSRGLRLAFCTVSGKASTVLKSKLTGILKEGEDYCGTIHSLIYMLVGKKQLNSGRSELYFAAREDLVLPYDVIILDEASMVNEYMFNDLSDLGIPILAVGDHGQLPPVKGSFNLMDNPQIKLETIMRQAEGNPIIKMARMARLDGNIPYGDYGLGCIKTRDVSVLHKHSWKETNSIVLCALNKTRVKTNDFAREKLGFNNTSPNKPLVGEPVICLYNNRRKMIFNGNIGVLQSIVPTTFESPTESRPSFNVLINMGDFEYANMIDMYQFGKEYTNVEEKCDGLDYFDWAYCVSVWKAQGSEWDNVLLIEEAEWMLKDNWPKFLYTAVTRAKSKIVIFKR